MQAMRSARAIGLGLGVWCGLVSSAAAAAAGLAEAASGAASSPPDSDLAAELSVALVWLAIAAVGVAQLSAGWVLERYRRRLLGFMGAASRKALGLAAVDAPPLSSAQVLAAMEGQRRRALRILAGMVLFYSLAAGLAWGYGSDSSRYNWLSHGVSVAMFAALTAPVVLLGVSAANFARLFWVWVAPLAFATVAMQIVIINGLDRGVEESDRPLWALAAVVLLTGLAVAVREWTPPAHWQRARQWVGAHRKACWALAVLAVLATFVLIGLVAEDAPAAAGEAAHDVEVGGVRVPVKLNVWQIVFTGCAGAAAAIAACYVTMVDRIKRIVVPLVAVGLFTLLFVAAVLSIAALSAGVGGWVMAAGVIGALALAWLLANFALSWIGLAYDQKLFSDAQFQVFCWMLAISGVVIGIETLVNGAKLFDGLTLWLLGATALALVGYWLATHTLMRALPTNKRLLVLRVFGNDDRGERLLDELEYRWRFIGPIVLIGGPDVAARTIDPAKAANFLRRRLRDTFVPTARELHKRIAALDEHPDPDGRYRVNEFFCFDDLWKQAVQLLLDSADAVVLDLRGFNAHRGGTAYELGLLMQSGALRRTVLLADDSTDMLAVRVALGVGRSEPVAVGGMIKGESALQGQILVEALVHCAGAADAAEAAGVGAGVAALPGPSLLAA